MSDGLVLPLAACIVGLAWELEHPFVAVIAGVVVALAGALAFGWARYAGEREEISHNHPQLGLEEAERELALLKTIGIDDALTAGMKAEMEQERALWLKEIAEHELGWEHYDARRARLAAVHTALGFITGGIMVSLPFVIYNGTWASLVPPLCWSLCCLLVLGWGKGRFTGRPPVAAALLSAARGLAIAGVAGLIAWAVTQLR